MTDLKHALLTEARAAGFAKMGICRPDAIPEAAGRLAEFVAQGRHGQMGWMAERMGWRGDPTALWPEARSVIMLAEPYTPQGDPLEAITRRDRATISVYAQNRDYHDLVKKRLKRVGRWLLEFGEGTLSRIPLAGSVYKTLKQLLETFLRDNSTRFRRVVLVEYPREGLFSVGFVTGEVGPSLQSDLKEPLLSVFIPTAPNPTTGWYTLVPARSVKELEITVEEAFRTIISAGIVNPDDREAPVNRSFSSLMAQLRASASPSS